MNTEQSTVQVEKKLLIKPVIIDVNGKAIELNDPRLIGQAEWDFGSITGYNGYLQVNPDLSAVFYPASIGNYAVNFQYSYTDGENNYKIIARLSIDIIFKEGFVFPLGAGFKYITIPI